jgi:hypothetical protein
MLLILQSCASSNSKFNNNEFKKLKTLAGYSGMENEFQDAYLVLKENGNFKFYQKYWVIFSFKQAPYIGTYLRKNDALYLNWIDTDPKYIKYYLSNKCVVDPTKESLLFVDETTNQPLWSMSLTRKK